MKNNLRQCSLILVFTIFLILLPITSHAVGLQIVSVKDINATVYINKSYSLPKTVPATMNNKTIQKITIVWGKNKVITSKAGTYIFSGTIKGYSKKVVLTLKVIPLPNTKVSISTTPPSKTDSIPSATTSSSAVDTIKIKAAPELVTTDAGIRTSETLKLVVKNYDGNIDWVSSDPYIASVDKSGVVTGMHKAGVVSITAKAGDEVLTCKVTNNITMQDISAKELVSKIKIGSNFASTLDYIDFDHRIGYDDYENGSSKIFIAFSLFEPGKDGYYFNQGINMRKGDSIHQVIPLNGLGQCDPSLKLSRAVLQTFYHGNGNSDGKMTIKVSNAKVTVGDKVYRLDYLNGTNTVIMKAELNQAYKVWSSGNSIGDTANSDLPKVSELLGGVFEADITIIDINEANKPDKATYYITNEGMNKLPTKEMVKTLKEAGYDAIRLTVSYTPHMNNNTFIIDKSWFDKVEEEINWILSNNMYCIINSHYDYLGTSWVGDHWSGAWMLPKYRTYVDERFAMMWKQIAERFKDYDDYLMFESMNEPGMSYDVYISEGGKPDDFNTIQADCINELNNSFYSAVQNTGGNNQKRFLMFPSINEIYGYLDYLKLPASNKIIASVHSYFFPQENGSFTDTFVNTQASYEAVVQRDMSQIAAFMAKTGVPVIIGEFVSTQEVENNARIYQASYLVDKAAEIGVPCLWWECGDQSQVNGNEKFSLYDRESMNWVHKDILQAIVNMAKKR